MAHLIFPDDVQTLPSTAAAGAPAGRISGAVVVPAEDDLARAATMINAARRAMIVIGQGAVAVAAREAVIALAELVGAAVVTIFKGKGLIADTHPRPGGVLGRSGTPIASWFMNEADLIIALGSSFANHTAGTYDEHRFRVVQERAHVFEVTIGANYAVDGHRQLTDAMERDSEDDVGTAGTAWAAVPAAMADDLRLRLKAEGIGPPCPSSDRRPRGGPLRPVIAYAPGRCVTLRRRGGRGPDATGAVSPTPGCPASADHRDAKPAH